MYDQFKAAILLKSMCDTNSLNFKNETPLVAAIQFNKNPLQVVQLLFADTNLDIQDASGKTAIFWCLYKHQMPVFKLLLSKLSSFDIRDGDGNTLYLTAIKANFPEAVDVLEQRMNVLKQGIIDVNECNFANENAVSIVAYDKTNLLGRALIAKGVAVNQKNQAGMTALNIAITNGHVILAIQLLAARLLFLIASLPLKFPGDNTLKHLLSKGGDIHQCDVHQRTVFHVAGAYNNIAFHEFFVSRFDDSSKVKEIMETAIDDHDQHVVDVVGVNYTDNYYDFNDITDDFAALKNLANSSNCLSEVNELLHIYQVLKQALPQNNPPVIPPDPGVEAWRASAALAVDFNLHESPLTIFPPPVSSGSKRSLPPTGENNENGDRNSKRVREREQSRQPG